MKKETKSLKELQNIDLKAEVKKWTKNFFKERHKTKKEEFNIDTDPFLFAMKVHNIKPCKPKIKVKKFDLKKEIKRLKECRPIEIKRTKEEMKLIEERINKFLCCCMA